MAFVGFNAKTVAPANNNFELIPKGKYLAVCIDSEVKTNKSNTGDYLKLVFEIIEGPYKGRRVFEQLNIRHTNPKAVEVALSTLSTLCHAIEVLEVGDSNMLHNIPVILDLGIESGRDGFGDKNRIYHYYSAKQEQYTRTSSVASAPTLTPWGTGKPAAPAIEDDIPF